MQGVAKRDVTYAAPDYRARMHRRRRRYRHRHRHCHRRHPFSETCFPPHRDHEESTVASRLIPSLVFKSVPVLHPFPPFVRKVSCYVTSCRVQLAETSGAAPMLRRAVLRVAGRRRNKLPRRMHGQKRNEDDPVRRSTNRRNRPASFCSGKREDNLRMMFFCILNGEDTP